MARGAIMWHKDASVKVRDGLRSAAATGHLLYRSGERTAGQSLYPRADTGLQVYVSSLCKAQIHT